MAETKRFSLLYPSPIDSVENSFVHNPDIIKQLGAGTLLWGRSTDFFAFLTDDCDVIEYRQNIFSDMSNIPELTEMIDKSVGILKNIDELRRFKEKSYESEALLYSVKEIEVYINLIDLMAEKLSVCKDKINSEGMKKLCDYVLTEAESVEYKNLKENTAKLTVSINNIKSVTIGCNLDSTLSPYESGILSINTEYIRSGDLIDRLLSLDNKKDEFTALAPLVASGKQFTAREKESVDMVFNAAIKKIYGSSLRQWEPMIKKYLSKKTELLLFLLPELYFLSTGAKILADIKRFNLPLCKPIVRKKEEKVCRLIGLYNPVVALQLKEENPVSKVVLNNFSFDENGMIYILTGPNRGGKSVLTCAVGIAQIFFQLGLSIPAKHAELSPVGCIYTHFATDAKSTLQKGRLGEECDRMQRIFSTLTEFDLVLLDETLSSTDSYEGSFIAEEIVAGLSAFSCRAIYCTHMHELAAKADEINAKGQSLSKVDTLVAGIEEGERSFIISRVKPDGKSYARDIAEKYGLSYQKILAMKEKTQK
jgi:DNA mismatch repair protein MutS